MSTLLNPALNYPTLYVGPWGRFSNPPRLQRWTAVGTFTWAYQPRL